MKKIVCLGILAFVTGTTSAHAGERNLGSGIVFSAPNTALFRNTTGLLDSENISLQGLWRFEINNPSASITTKQGQVAFGAGYRQEGGGSGVNVFEGGAAANLGPMDLGVTVRSVEGEGLDGDIGARVNVGSVSLGFVARAIDGGFDRYDAGIGFELSPQVSFEFDVKKPRPFDSDLWLADVAIVFNAERVSLEVGYDMARNDENSDGHLHAGLSFAVTSNVYLEGYYRPFAQEWSTDDWAAGLRATF